jgi:hypothetical protein
LKIAIAAAILGTGIAAMFSAHGKIISNNAVIATNLVSLRTPIDGMVSELPDRAGVVVAKGALIAHIENLRVNDEHLVDLRAHQTRVEADLKAARDNRADLLSLQSDLIRRDEIHIKVNGERLASLVNEAGKAHAALTAKEAQAQNDVDRHLPPLEASGIVSKAEMHRLRSVLGARQDVAARPARRAAHRGRSCRQRSPHRDDRRNGQNLFRSTRGSNRNGDFQSRQDYRDAETHETQSRLAAEQKRIEVLRFASIVAPSASMSWKLGAADGERLGTGDMVAEIVDCNAPFLLAAIPQDRFSDVEAGGTRAISLIRRTYRAKRHGCFGHRAQRTDAGQH